MMNLIPRNNLFDIDRLFEDFWTPVAKGELAEKSFFSPRVDIKELDDHYEITAELPGVDKKDVDISLTDGILTITAECSKEEKEEKKGKIIRQERRYGKYLRSFNLGGNVHEEDITASFKDGVLSVKAPKIPEPTPKQRRIEVH